jgi:hypothetical protein
VIVGSLFLACQGNRGEQNSGATQGEDAETTADSTGPTTGNETTADTSSDGSTSNDSTADTDTDDNGTESETGPACEDPECKLNGSFGIGVRIPVTWEAMGPIEAGDGNVRVTLKVTLGTAGTSISGYAEVCELGIPLLPEAGGNEQYELNWRRDTFPNAIPDLNVVGETCGSLPDQTVSFEVFPVQIGVDLPGPINGQWPADYMDIPIADHDADGRPAWSVRGGQADSYYAPPLDGGKVDRAAILYYASRVVVDALDGMLVNCEGGPGDAEVSHLDITAVGCRVCQGDQPDNCVDQSTDCSDTQIDYLNGYAGVFEVGAPSYNMLRVDANLDCDAVSSFF